MKIAFISRATLFKDKGGDTIQVMQTARHLKKLGVEVDIHLANEYFDYNQYDLIHFFNIIRPDDILPHINKTKKPFVVSTIFVDYSEYEKKVRKGIVSILLRPFSDDMVEYAKSIARFLINGEKIKSTYYFF